MGDSKRLICRSVLMVFCVISFFSPLAARGAESTATLIAEAKTAIEQARQAGAEKKAPDHLAQAKSWLAQAEKEYADSQSILSRTMKLVISNEQRAREIHYMATMAKTKAQIAEAKAKKAAVVDELQETRKDLADYQTSLEVLNKKLAEAEKAKGIQAKAETELKGLAESKKKAAELEEQKKRELTEAQQKMAELEALKQKEIQQSRLQEAQRTAEREKELSEARLKAERLAFQKEKEEAEKKARDGQMAAEREKMAAMERKMAAMEKEKAMLADAAKIPETTIRSANGEMVVTLLAINLFSSKNELHAQGRALLDKVGIYLKKYSPGRFAVRGYADSTGKAADNQTLSEKRAQKVKEYLAVYQNIPAANIAAEGLGATQPVASNATEAGRALNRRVEIGIPIGQ
jgi:outer membrane protein OmpA-like peptidoglycan-associated protein